MLSLRGPLVHPLLLSRGQDPKPRDAVSKTLFLHSCAVLEHAVAGSGAFAKTQFRHSCAVRGYLGRQGNTGFSAIFSVCVFSVSNTILFWLI